MHKNTKMVVLRKKTTKIRNQKKKNSFKRKRRGK